MRVSEERTYSWNNLDGRISGSDNAKVLSNVPEESFSALADIISANFTISCASSFTREENSVLSAETSSEIP